MGMSSKAILFWGVPVPEDSDLHERIEREFHDLDEGGDVKQGTLAWLSWMGVTDGGCTLGQSREFNFPLYFLAVKESVFESTGSKPLSIDAAFLSVPHEWPGKFAAFLAKYGLPPDEPRWWMVSYRG